MDSIDRAILEQLRRNAHLTNTELADRVGGGCVGWSRMGSSSAAPFGSTRQGRGAAV
jgi:DNA-binding Lrp family transcriptional regulator